MPLSKAHKAASRERIVRGAGRLFRRVGYEAASVSALMAEAGLTHGGFYAHFGSKQALFAAVVESDHGLLRQLGARDAADAVGWRRQTRQVLTNYLLPAHLDAVRTGCSFVALTGDTARADDSARAAWQQAFRELAAQWLRRPGETAAAAWARSGVQQRERAVRLSAAAVGALMVAAALAPDPLTDPLLRGTLADTLRQLDAL